LLFFLDCSRRLKPHNKYKPNRGEKMKNAKTKIATIALIIVLLLTLLTISSSIVHATDRDTYAFLAVAPNPIGVGQTALITMWLDKTPPVDAEGWSIVYEGFKVDVTKPDGSKESLGPYKSDPVGTKWTQYTPDQVGAYIFQFSFPGQTIIGYMYGSTVSSENYFKPSTSPEVELTVQEDPIAAYPSTPLPGPNRYWERSIDAQNRDWWSISGNWLGCAGPWYGYYNATGTFNPYSKAPNTAHIVWTKPIAFGGLVGGQFGDTGYYTGLSYEPKFQPPVIMNGRLYYNLPLSNNPNDGGCVCVDLRTGEELWWQDIVIHRGQLYDYETPNQHGVIPYLWKLGSTYEAYDPVSGELIYTIANATFVRRKCQDMLSPLGDLLVYIIDGNGDWLAMWNSSRIPQLLLGSSGTNAWQWRPVGKTVDWQNGIQWNVSIPDVPPGVEITRISQDIILATFDVMTGSEPVIRVIGYSAKTGEQLWSFDIPTFKTFPWPFNFSPIMDGVFTYFKQETLQTYGYDVYTGKQIWGPTEPYENAWSMFYASWCGGGPMSPVTAYGKLYATTYDGRIHCHDLNSGEELWNYYTGNSGFETPYGHWPLYGSVTVADGKVYAPTNEHSPTDPMWRGSRLHCVNAETGEGIWSLLGWMVAPAIADGYLVVCNYYDQDIYCIGKGSSRTTVTAPDISATLGSSVVIRGTVTDESPGTKEGIGAVHFPNGVPAIADEYMTEWMEYLYMQQPCPDYFEGVEVKLETLDPNGNFYEIGTVTSDASGMFKLMWEPPVPGEYTIIATFEGSGSYWSSYAETAIGVTEAPSPGEPIQPEPTEPAEAPLITIEMAILLAAIVIAIAVLAGFYIIRKRK
jgi:outer membrane protein assembly factor BamB